MGLFIFEYCIYRPTLYRTHAYYDFAKDLLHVHVIFRNSYNYDPDGKRLLTYLSHVAVLRATLVPAPASEQMMYPAQKHSLPPT